MSKQDRQGARTPADLERKYQFGKSFTEIMGIATDARIYAEEAKDVAEEAKTIATEISETDKGIALRVEELEKGIGGQFKVTIETENTETGEKKVYSLIDGEATKIHFKSDSILIESTNFTLTEDGTMEAKAGTFGNVHITTEGSAWGTKYDGIALGSKLNDSYFGVNDDENSSYRAFLGLGLKTEKGVLLTNKDIEIAGVNDSTAKYIEWDELYTAVNPVDKIIEEGTSNGWTYKKWKNGTYEMFGVFTYSSTAVNTASGSAYYSNTLYITTPFSISSAIISGNASQLCTIVNSENTEDTITFRLLSPKTLSAGVATIYVNLYVVGQYT